MPHYLTSRYRTISSFLAYSEFLHLNVPLQTDQFSATPCTSRTSQRESTSSASASFWAVQLRQYRMWAFCLLWLGLGFPNPSSKDVFNKWMSCAVNHRKKVVDSLASFIILKELKGPWQGRRPFIYLLALTFPSYLSAFEVDSISYGF